MPKILILPLILAALVTGCAYKFGLSEKQLPGGYTQVAIPVFKNKTAEVGIEPYFTNALIRQFARSQVARVTDKESSPLVLEGTIISVDTTAGPQISGENTGLPGGTVLTTQYQLIVKLDLSLKRKSDEKVIWSGVFQNEKVYQGARLTTEVVNSANATYNQSVRMETISSLAQDMMVEAHDRMTENF